MSMDEQWAREHIGTTPAVEEPTEIAMLTLQIRRAMAEESVSVTLPQNWVIPVLADRDRLEAENAELRAQLEAQRGGGMELTEDALSLVCGCELPPVEGADAIKFGLRNSLRSGYRNGWRDACAKMQRGGAVVVAEHPTPDQIRKAGYTRPVAKEVQDFMNGWACASRLSAILAGRVLSDGMVGVDRETIGKLIDLLNCSVGAWEDVRQARNILATIRSTKGEVEG